MSIFVRSRWIQVVRCNQSFYVGIVGTERKIFWPDEVDAVCIEGEYNPDLLPG